MIRNRAARPAAAATLMLLGVCVASPAHAADDDGTPFRLDYDASGETCPDREAFVREIRARTKRPRLVTRSDEATITLHVLLIEAAGETSSTGRLDVREADGTTETRTVDSRTCAEVAKGLALVAALVLDPDARTTDADPTSTPAAPAPVRPPSPPLLVPPPPPPPAAPASPGTRTRGEWSASAGPEVGVLGGIGPAIAPMAGAFFELEHTSKRDHVSSARMSFDVARTSSDLARGGRQTYEWLGGTVRACPVYVSLLQGLRATPCAALQVGLHRATTQKVPNPTTGLDLWLAPAAVATIEWAVTRTIGLELSGGALLPIRRTRYFLAPDTTIFEVPAVTGTANFALRVRIL